MSTNALTDVPWVQITLNGEVSWITVKEALSRAHENGWVLDKKNSGYNYGAQMRLLRDVLAVVLRYEKGYEPGYEESLAESLLEEGIDESALDQGLRQLEEGADLFSPTFPFLQRPAVTPESPKDSARLLAPGKQPVKKLLPAMPADQGEDFWNLSVSQPDSLGLAEAVQSLAIHHHYSMAGNNAYDGEKCAMGAPGIRFLGKGNTATEIFWEAEEPENSNLLATLLQSLPKNWVEGRGLPAWADRLGKTALLPDGTEHPLWAGSWSSNTVACLWDGGEQLVGVRTGGIPEEWYLPTMGQDKDSRKSWWDNRNTRDPFYLYMPDQQQELKAQRLDLSRDATDLAVEWASEHKMVAAQEQRNRCFYSDDRARLSFIRHQIEGTASSPSIRASQIHTPDKERWAFGCSEEIQELIQEQARTIRQVHGILCSPFRRKTKDDEKKIREGYVPVLLDNLSQLKPDVSACYWRAITPVYIDFIQNGTATPDGRLPQDFFERVLEAAIGAYDATVLPYRNQNAARIEYVRGQLYARLRKAMNIIKETPNQEDSDDE